MDIDYKKKYLKYKEKYLALKKLEKKLTMIGGGEEKLDVFLFKAEWCGHCKAFKPTWELLENQFKKKYNFHTYDYESNKKEIEEWQIQGFPTIIAKKGKTASEYRGPRNIDSLVEFFNYVDKI
jgi:thiol-disulfide isomerase/thioredoxin